MKNKIVAIAVGIIFLNVMICTLDYRIDKLEAICKSDIIEKGKDDK